MIEVPKGYHVCKSRDATMTICEPVNGQFAECLYLCESVPGPVILSFTGFLFGVILVMLAWGMWKGRSRSK